MAEYNIPYYVTTESIQYERIGVQINSEHSERLPNQLSTKKDQFLLSKRFSRFLILLKITCEI